MPGAQRPRVLVMGCGGIGGLLTAKLVEAGQAQVLTVAHDPAIAAQARHAGLRYTERDTTRCVAAEVVTALPPDAGTFDFVFLCTQPTQVVEAAINTAPSLARDGALVCFQNGLCEERVAPLVGRERVLGAVVLWGASMVRPARYERTSSGGFVLGRLDGRVDDPRLGRLAELLAPAGPVTVTANLAGARWSKLALNCAISSLGTLGGARLGSLLRYRFVRRLALEVMSEAVALARSAGVRLEKLAGTVDLEWVALTPEEARGPGTPSLVAKHALLLAVGARYRRLRSSMLAAIERGRIPAVDYLNGEVVRRAAALGRWTPVNARLRTLVWDLWRRQARPGLVLLRRLYAETRADATAAVLAGYRGRAGDALVEVAG